MPAAGCRIIQSPQPLGEAHYKHFLYQLLLGLRFAHAHGVIHRDIKPANLLVTKSCDLVISDFGLARQMPSEAGPMTEHVVTRWYRAPEVGCVPPCGDTRVRAQAKPRTREGVRVGSHAS